jgi:hypothetical protein
MNVSELRDLLENAPANAEVRLVVSTKAKHYEQNSGKRTSAMSHMTWDPQHYLINLEG